MINKIIFSVFSGVLVCLFSFAGIAATDSLISIQFVTIASDNANATIKKADGSLQIIQPGDVIADDYTVKSITPGRIVLEKNTADGPRPLVIRLENGRQRIEPQRNNRRQSDQLGSQQSGPPLPTMPARQ